MDDVYCVYFIATDNHDFVKIGVTGATPEKRLACLQTGNHRQLKVLYSIPCETAEDAYALESSLHGKFEHLREAGEWFRFGFGLMSYIQWQKYEDAYEDWKAKAEELESSLNKSRNIIESLRKKLPVKTGAHGETEETTRG